MLTWLILQASFTTSRSTRRSSHRRQGSPGKRRMSVITPQPSISSSCSLTSVSKNGHCGQEWHPAPYPVRPRRLHQASSHGRIRRPEAASSRYAFPADGARRTAPAPPRCASHPGGRFHISDQRMLSGTSAGRSILP